MHPRAVGPGVARFDVPIADFSLDRVEVAGADERRAAVSGASIALATAGELVVVGATSGASLTLRPGGAALVTADEGSVCVSGHGELFLASPGGVVG